MIASIIDELDRQQFDGLYIFFLDFLFDSPRIYLPLHRLKEDILLFRPDSRGENPTIFPFFVRGKRNILLIKSHPFLWNFFYKTKSRRVQSNYCTLQHHFLPLFPIRHIFPFLFMIITWSQRERRQIRRAHDADEDESHNPIFGRWTFNSGNSFFFLFFFFAVGFLVLSIFFSFLPVDLFPQCWFGKGRRALLFWFYIDWNIFLFLKVVSFSQSAGKLIEDDVEANKQGKVNFLETLQKKYIRKTFLKNGQKRQKITLAKSKTCGCVEAQGAIISFLCRWMSVCVVSELMSDVFTPQKLFWTELDLSKWMLFVAKN